MDASVATLTQPTSPRVKELLGSTVHSSACSLLPSAMNPPEITVREHSRDLLPDNKNHYRSVTFFLI